MQVNADKESPPSTENEVTSITINTVTLRIFISRKKCSKTLLALRAFLDHIAANEPGKPKGYTRLHDLDKIIGKLNHLSIVVRGGRLWLQPLWDVHADYERACCLP